MTLTTFLLLRALSLFGQQGATAELTGRVSSSGQSLPGVTVTLTSEALQGSRVTTTGENGGYLFALLPPADYRLHFELPGFTAAERYVRVSLAGTTRIDVELRSAPLQETIMVEADRTGSGSADASVATNFRAAELDRLPVGRDIRGAVLLSPGTSAQGHRKSIVIAGAPSWDSLFLVDGVVVNEYLSGQPHNLILEDAIQEVVLLTGAISAEFGRFTGGVVSTLTKSGGNEFSGSLRDRVSNGAWMERTPWPDQPSALDKTNHTFEGTLGGFLRKDRLWFFGAARHAESFVGRFTTLTNVPYQSSSEEQRWEGKLTAQIAPQHSLVASYMNTSLAEKNVVEIRGIGRVMDLSSVIPDRRQPTRFLALTTASVLSSDVLAEVHYSQKSYALRGNGGQSRDRILGTLITARTVNANMNAPLGCGICGDDRRDSNSWSAKGSHYRNTRWGNHNVVLGAESFHEERHNKSTRSASDFNIQASSVRILGANVYPVFDASTLISWTPHLAGDRGSDLNTSSAYLSDRWDINPRLNLSLGLRYDRNNARDAVGRLISNDASYNPRVSATFDLRNDGRHRLLGGFGRYASKILEGGGAPQQIGVFESFGWRYRGPEINGGGTPVDHLLPTHEALARLWAWFDSVGGIQNRQFLSFINNPLSAGDFHGSLKSPAVEEWTLGYAFQLPSGFLRADYIARDWRNFYAVRVDTTTGQRQDAYGNTIDVVWILNDSGIVRTYRALQLQGSWRHKELSIGGGYIWSKLRGNDDAEEGIMTGPRITPLPLWYPEFLGYPRRQPVGPLKQDQPHRARIWIAYEKPFGAASLSASLLQWFDSGTPYSAIADIDPTGRIVPYEGTPPNPGYVFSQATVGLYYFSKRGAFRTDDVLSTDIAVNYEMPYRGVRLFVKGETLNLFNNSAVVAVDAEVITRFRGGAASGLRAFNPFTETPIEGVHYRLSPTFGKPTGPDSYQTPRDFRFSLGARF